jgi:hypothetical protein
VILVGGFPSCALINLGPLAIIIDRMATQCDAGDGDDRMIVDEHDDDSMELDQQVCTHEMISFDVRSGLAYDRCPHIVSGLCCLRQVTSNARRMPL